MRIFNLITRANSKKNLAPRIIDPKIINVRGAIQKHPEETVWEAIGNGRQLKWREPKQILMLLNNVKGDVNKKLHKLIESSDHNNRILPAPEPVHSGSPADYVNEDNVLPEFLGVAGEELGIFVTELGLSIPVLSQLKAIAKLSVATGKLARSTYHIKRHDTLASNFTAKSEYFDLANKPLIKLLKKQLMIDVAKFAVGTINVALTFADTTTGGSATSGGMATANFLVNLAKCYRAHKEMIELKKILRTREDFKLDVLVRAPILGAYLFNKLDKKLLLGLCYDYQDDTTEEQKRQDQKERLEGNEAQIFREVFDNHLGKIQDRANAFINNHAFELVERPEVSRG